MDTLGFIYLFAFLAICGSLLLLAGVNWARWQRPLHRWSNDMLYHRVMQLEKEKQFLSDFFVGPTMGPIKRQMNQEAIDAVLHELECRGLYECK